MRKTTTIFKCDGCGSEFREGRALRPFALIRLGRRSLITPKADLCDDCEARLIEAVEPILGADAVELRRDPETEQPRPRTRSRR